MIAAAPRSIIQRSFALFLTLSLVLPTPVGAVSTWGLDDTGNVQLGEFLKASFEALSIDTDANPAVSQLLRGVPKSLAPYYAKAYNRGALKLVESNMSHTRTVSRGNAAFMLMQLAGENATGLKGTYRDIDAGSDLEDAARVAVKKGWFAPMRTNFFGADRVLSNTDAIKLMNKVSGRVPMGSARVKTKNGTEKVISISLTKPKTTRVPKADILEAVWQILNDDYLYSDKIDPEAAGYKAIEALMESLDDPYSSFLRPAKAQNFRSQIQGEVTGIGAQVEEKSGVLTIVTPLRGSPAEKAGLLPGDEILAVDGVSLTGLNFTDAVDKVRGPKGSTAKLHIRRSGNEMDVSVVRDTITVPEIEITWQGNVALVRLMQFGELTDAKLRGEMAKVQEQNPTGVILDLRNNPGGLLHAASTVLSNFVPKGSAVAKIKSKADERTDYTEEEPTIGAGVKLVVLINGGSASASEIVAGALQDAKRGTLVGQKTFGKGTVQEILQFNDKSSLKLTIAEWFTPLGRKIDGVGVEPDVKVEYTSSRDEQLLKALDLLR